VAVGVVVSLIFSAAGVRQAMAHGLPNPMAHHQASGAPELVDDPAAYVNPFVGTTEGPRVSRTMAKPVFYAAS
jgi:hypothetical protein